MRIVVAEQCGLRQSDIDNIREIFSRYPHISTAILYGSRAMGNYRPASDIDITLQGTALSYSELAKVATELDDLMLPYTVDLSIYHHIDNQDLVDHIQRVGLEFYAK